MTAAAADDARISAASSSGARCPLPAKRSMHRICSFEVRTAGCCIVKPGNSSTVASGAVGLRIALAGSSTSYIRQKYTKMVHSSGAATLLWSFASNSAAWGVDEFTGAAHSKSNQKYAQATQQRAVKALQHTLPRALTAEAIAFFC